MTDVEREGGCLCGAVRFRARGEPRRVGICHCRMCRKNTGAPYLAFAVYAVGCVEIVGSLTSARAPTIDRMFCPDCGSLIFLQDKEDELDLAIGAFDDPPVDPPQYELWSAYRPPWLPGVEGAVSYVENRDGARLED